MARCDDSDDVVQKAENLSSEYGYVARLTAILRDLPRLLKEHPLTPEQALYLKERIEETVNVVRDTQLEATDMLILEAARDRDDYRGLMTAMTRKLWECDPETRKKRARRILVEVNALMTQDERASFQKYICRAWNLDEDPA